MSTDFEQRLRAEMEQVAVRPRPGLVNEAYRSYRGKRRIRAVAATGAAVAIAAGTAVGIAAATASPAAIPAQTTAYVVSHVSSALTTTNRIMYTTTITSFGPPSNAQLVTYVWEYGAEVRELQESASGQPMWDNWVQADHGKLTRTWVDYRKRSWDRSAVAHGLPAGSAGLSLCRAPGALIIAQSATPAYWKAVIEAGLRCGLFHVAGHQRVEGIDAIKLTGGTDSGIMLSASPNDGISIWLDPHTYLPVQLAGTEATLGPKPAAVLMHFRWLPPTQANLAQLAGTIPPGFQGNLPSLGIADLLEPAGCCGGYYSNPQFEFQAFVDNQT